MSGVLMVENGGSRGLTYADWVALGEDVRRHELIEGELVFQPSAVVRHQEIVMELGLALAKHVEAQGLGWVFCVPLDVILSDNTVLQPDVQFISREREEILREHVHGAPDLCVEVLSPETARMDRVRKLDLYARFGVGNYWIVDVERRVIEEYTLHGDVFAPRAIVPYDGVFRPALFPGFEFRLDVVSLPAP